MRAVARMVTCHESMDLTSGICMSTATGDTALHDGFHRSQTLWRVLTAPWIPTKTTYSESDQETLVMRTIARMTNPFS